MNNKEITNNCQLSNTQFYDYKKIKIIQDDDSPLKDLSTEKYISLKNSIIDHGIISPIHIWIDQNGEMNSLDGTQRLKTFEAMENEGYKIPLIPCVIINAENEKKAKKILLTLISQYGKVNEQGLYEYVVKNEIDLEWLKNSTCIPNVNLEKFIENHFDLDILKNEVSFDETDQQQFILTVILKNESELQSLYEEISKKGHECKIIM